MDYTTRVNATKETGLAYLGGVNISSKLKKNMIVNQMTYCMYFAPANTSGYNVCSHSTIECRLGCLATSGRTGMEIIAGKNRIQNSRLKKTKLFYENPQYFLAWMIDEIKHYQKKAEKLGFEFSIRLNGTSDIDWNNVKINGQTIFEMFSETQFYDYTKSILKFNEVPKNYHLTYSFTGRNVVDSLRLLEKGFNVAVVFNVQKNQKLPEMFLGYEVIDGDKNDYRVNDNNGVIVGLRFKHIANKEAENKVLNSCFIIQPNDERCTQYNVQKNVLELI